MDKYLEVQNNSEKYFNSGYNCCEAVVLAVSEYFGLDGQTALRIATPFGSGMSRNGNNCGVLSAAFILSGLKNGRNSNKEDRDSSYLPADVIFNKFKEKYSSNLCFDITGVNMKDSEEAKNNKERLHGVVCGPIVRQVTEWILEELDK